MRYIFSIVGLYLIVILIVMAVPTFYMRQPTNDPNCFEDEAALLVRTWDGDSISDKSQWMCIPIDNLTR